MMGNGEASGPAMGLYALAARDMFRLIAQEGEMLQSLQVFVSSADKRDSAPHLRLLRAVSLTRHR